MARLSLFLLMSLVAALGLAHFAPRFVDADFLSTTIERRLSEALGQSVSVGDEVSFQILPRPVFQVSDLVVEPESSSILGAADSAPIMTAKAVTAYVHPWSILFGGFQAQRLEIIEPMVRLERDAQGETFWSRAPMFAAMTSAGALLREQNNRGAEHRGLSATVELAGATFQISDAVTGYRAAWHVPRLALTPTDSGASLAFDGKFETADWQLTGEGTLNLGLSALGARSRPFHAEFSGFNADGSQGFELLQIDGELSEAALNQFSVTANDPWRLRAQGIRHPIVEALTPLVHTTREGSDGTSVRSARNAQNAQNASLVLDIDSPNLSFGQSQWSLQNVRFALSSPKARRAKLFEADGSLRVAGETAAKNPAEPQTRLTLALTAHQQTVSERLATPKGALVQTLVETMFETLGQAVGDTGDNLQIAWSFNGLDIAPQGQPGLASSMNLVGVFDEQGMGLGQSTLSVPGVLEADLVEAEVSLDGAAKLVGSIALHDAQQQWVQGALPVLMALAPTAQAVTLSGALESPDITSQSLQVTSGTLDIDGMQEIDLKMSADGLAIFAPSLDLAWLAKGGGNAADVELPLAKGAEGYEDHQALEASGPRLLRGAMLLAGLPSHFGVPSVIVEADDGRMGDVGLGASRFQVRQAGEEQKAQPAQGIAPAIQTVLVAASIEGGLPASATMEVHLDATGTHPHPHRLNRLRAELAPAPDIAAQLGIPANVLAHPYLVPSGSKPMEVRYTREQGWSLSQDSHIITWPNDADTNTKINTNTAADIDTDTSGIRWQKSPVDPALAMGLTHPLDLLVAKIPTAARGYFDPTGDAAAQIDMLAIVDGVEATIQGEDTKARATYELTDFPLISFLPSVSPATADIVRDADGGRVRSFAVTGEGWQARLNLESSPMVADVTVERMSVAEALDVVASNRFADALLLQGEVELNLSVAQLVGQNGQVVAENAQAVGRYRGGRLTLDTVVASLGDGALVEGSGRMDISGGIAGDLKLTLALPSRTFTFGPFRAEVAKANVPLSLRFAGLNSDEIIGGISARFELKDVPITMGFLDRQNAGARLAPPWLSLLAASEDGRALAVLASRTIHEGLYLSSGSLSFRRGRWRLSQLALAPISRRHTPFTVEGTWDKARQTLDATAQADISATLSTLAELGGRSGTLTLATTGAPDDPALRLLGTYFRE